MDSAHHGWPSDLEHEQDTPSDLGYEQDAPSDLGHNQDAPSDLGHKQDAPSEQSVHPPHSHGALEISPDDPKPFLFGADTDNTGSESSENGGQLYRKHKRHAADAPDRIEIPVHITGASHNREVSNMFDQLTNHDSSDLFAKDTPAVVLVVLAVVVGRCP